MTKFARAIDVLTFEFENIPAQTIDWAARERIVRPRGEVLHIAQNRLREKQFLAGAGFRSRPFARRELDDLTSALETIGRPAILKTAAFGYDGKGQERIDAETDAAAIWSGPRRPGMRARRRDRFREGDLRDRRARTGWRDGGFPGVRERHRDHILDVTVAPARVAPAVATAARELAVAVAEKLDLVGLLAVEMFLRRDGQLVINELAPRPHNSGHWTIEGCATSQFEQHVRAVCGMPLGATDLLRPSAMANLLGDLWQDGEPHWAAALARPAVHLHLYGKSEPRPRRKMGHLTALRANRRGSRRVRPRANGSCTRRLTDEVISTRILAERSWAVEEAANLLRRGEIVALPTETVYGLAADARNAEAVVKIFEAKDRPRFDPLIVHLPDASWLDRSPKSERPSARRCGS